MPHITIFPQLHSTAAQRQCAIRDRGPPPGQLALPPIPELQLGAQRQPPSQIRGPAPMEHVAASVENAGPAAEQPAVAPVPLAAPSHPPWQVPSAAPAPTADEAGAGAEAAEGDQAIPKYINN